MNQGRVNDLDGFVDGDKRGAGGSFTGVSVRLDLISASAVPSTTLSTSLPWKWATWHLLTHCQLIQSHTNMVSAVAEDLFENCDM